MASKIDDLRDEGRRDRLLIKKAEKELKDSFARRILPSVNSQLSKHYLAMLQSINDCHKLSPSFDSLNECIEQAEAPYFRKQNIARASLTMFQRECQTCLTTCKSDMNQPITKCYQDCLIRFKRLSDEL